MKYLIFTYGTLMKGQKRQHVMDKCRYIGDAILDDYGLYEIGTYPAAIRMDGFKVYGEVYEVDEKVKKELDFIEDVGNLYNFVEVKVLLNDEYVPVNFYEFIDKGVRYPIRKPEGKWNSIRNDIEA